MTVRIITDSASDMLQSQAKEAGITVVPLIINFSGVEYLDGVTLSHEEFFEKLVNSKELPTTSQATPITFTEVFREALQSADEVVAVILSSKLSGTYQSACIAATGFEGKVHVVDSENVCLGQMILVQRAKQLADQGLSADEIVATLDREKKQIRLMAVLDTLEYLKKGGRISAATAFAGGLLSIKPVVTVEGGDVILKGKARGSKNANNMLRNFIEGSNGVNFDMPYLLAYSGNSDALLQNYIDDHKDLWQHETDKLPILTVGCIIGTHVGPGAFAVAYFEKEA